MKLRLVHLIWLAAALLLASCASLLGPREVEIPLARLQQTIASRFPFNNHFLELLDVRVTNPRVALQPETNRIVTSMDTSITPPFTDKSWSGSFSISGQLQVDPARNALVLADPRVENLAIDGLNSPYARQISRIASLIGEQLLKDQPLYTFQPSDFHYGGANFFPIRITAKATSLVVTFEPAR